MTYLKEIEALQARLSRMDSTAALAFCTLICYRLLPNYEFFSRESGFGNISDLKSAADFSFQSIGSENEMDIETISSFIERIESQTPDTEQFRSLYVSFALDACVAALETLEFIRDKDWQHVIAVSTSSTDTVHAFVQEKFAIEYEDIDYEAKMLTNPLVEEEVAFQERLIETLAQAAITKEELFDLRAAIQSGRSNIGL